jgi:hypothetical protein
MLPARNDRRADPRGQDTIDFANIDPTKVQQSTYSGTAASGTLSVTDGSHSTNIALIGNYLALDLRRLERHRSRACNNRRSHLLAGFATSRSRPHLSQHLRSCPLLEALTSRISFSDARQYSNG